ncbi:MAG: Na/Pi cotransporter family protein [Lawsonibacter sp.]|jgi:phosphate:Na+ symporter|nr:Na/Pi cotransporter family protein [Lawsonibacter sp.]
MDIFQVLTMIGGLSLFLFGMDLMGQALERRAGEGLRTLLGRLTTNRAAGLVTGLAVTAIIQSSSAATVMVVGFVNSGLMSLKQAINVIMGANIGTTVTAWLLSLAGIDSGNVLVKLLKPSSFTPVLALIGIILYMSGKNTKRQDTGTILLGFATLMFGMETMSGAVAGLGKVPAFQNLFLLFRNPLLGLLAGAVLTAVIQSSSASVGILQALAVTGQVSYSAAIPIIMGQNIGTCVTAMLSSVGANRNAKRAALVHLSFNVIGSAVWLTVFWAVQAVLRPPLLDQSASLFGIAAAHSVFNILCTLLLLPLSGVLERLVVGMLPDDSQPEERIELDRRLLATPPIALERCREVSADMARTAGDSLRKALSALHGYSPELLESVRKMEKKTDYYEDILGAYLVELSGLPISGADSAQAAKLLKLIGDLERLSDHAVNLAESAEELRQKDAQFTPEAMGELDLLTEAVLEILDMALNSFLNNDLEAAARVEPLEEVIDRLKEQLRTNHILRLQQGGCTIDAGFIWSDLLTNLERTADHCSNIAECVLDLGHHAAALHEPQSVSQEFRRNFKMFAEKYALEGRGGAGR